MGVLVRLQERLHIHDLALAGLQFLIMAGKTQRQLSSDKEPRLIGEMRIMAIAAALLIGHGPVLGGGPLTQHHFIGMAICAELRDRSGQHGLHGRTMGIVALDARLLCRIVSDLFGFEAFFLIGMTLETESVPFQDQSFGKIALMVVMASGAVPPRHRRVQDRVLHDAVRVTLKTDVRHWIFQHAFVRRLVGIMAGRAIPPLDRRMDHFLRVLGFMTHGAKVRLRLNEGDHKVPRMLCLLLRVINCLVTGRAHAFLYRIMDDLVLAHGNMTLGADAALRSCCGLGHTMTGKTKNNEQEFEQPDQRNSSDRMLFPHICLTP